MGRAGSGADNAPPARMVVEAKELVNDENNDTVTANGDVRIYYNGRFLRADHVVYDRKTARVFAQGHATLTETDGSVIHAEMFDFTDDFKNGFIESLQADTPDNTHFSAPRGERTSGESMVFDKGSYTACEACKDDPTKPRMWQLNAKRIIRDEVEKVIYYEDATFELLGMPIAYFPFLSGPDPTKKRQTGFLVPELNYGVSTLGAGRRPSVFLGDRARHGSDDHADLFHAAGAVSHRRSSASVSRPAIT